MPAFTAKVRLEIMGRALAIAEDRDAPIPLDDLAAELGIDRGRLEQALEPLQWIELRTGPNSFVSRLNDVELTDSTLAVKRGWWRQLTNLSPAEAARVYVQAAAAAELDADHSVHLQSAMRKLRRIVGSVTVASGPRPYVVNQLAEAQAEGRILLVDIEGTDRTVATQGATFAVISVYRHGPEWMVTLLSLDGNSALRLPPGGAVTMPASKVVAVVQGDFLDRETLEDAAPSVLVAEPSIEVVIEYPLSADWVLDPFDVTEEIDLPDVRRRARLRVWGKPELRTLLLRLGGDARLVEPKELTGLAAETAATLLAVYES